MLLQKPLIYYSRRNNTVGFLHDLGLFFELVLVAGRFILESEKRVALWL